MPKYVEKRESKGSVSKSLENLEPGIKRKSEIYGLRIVIAGTSVLVALSLIDGFIEYDLGWRPYIMATVVTVLGLFLWNPIATTKGLPKLGATATDIIRALKPWKTKYKGDERRSGSADYEGEDKRKRR